MNRPRRLAFFAYAVLAAVAPSALAQTPAPTVAPPLPDSGAPTTPASTDAPLDTIITSQSGEIWSSDTETRAIFEGNVIVTGNNLRLTCDRLEITAAGKNEPSATVGKLEKFKLLVAIGRVHIVQGAREANCARAEVFPRENKIVLTGQPVVIDQESGFVATGEPMELLRGERRVRGENVKITLPPVRDLGFDKNAPSEKKSEPAPTPKP
jgi:lipopolysaccharide export system protein LptA